MGTISAEQSREAVNLSNHTPFSKHLKSQLKETFFPDDPFRHISDHPPLRRTWAVLCYYIPILQWAPKYKHTLFASDLLAGITIASLAIPQGISYAKLANVPPIIGLYSSFVPPLVYAVFGSSNNLAVGTVAAVSLLLSSSIRGKVSPETEPELYLHTVFTAALFTGLFQLALGIFRLGILVDFLSRSTITGFMGGTAMIIILQQIKGLLGLQHFTTKTDLVSVVHAVFQNRQEWKWQSGILGLGFIVILLCARRLKEKVPRLFWVNAISPLAVVVMGGVIAFAVDGNNQGIPIVSSPSQFIKASKKRVVVAARTTKTPRASLEVAYISRGPRSPSRHRVDPIQPTKTTEALLNMITLIEIVT
ncbi:probable sulfate transporter 3.5 [Phalaenopsis equestris]|uniref:probable sulfate transporter 3.5 n=1 Tax=Phalaenopsis equestris TaxID=78828 RepID=UPI0009E287C6|nr:probable sulfate transporter 3.5 [Phalaenopsis equestris]